jgi:hypothetical protein
MSTIVLSSMEKFFSMSKKLQDMGVSNINFYSSESNREANTPMVSLVPFVDFVLLGEDAHHSPRFHRLIDEARSRHIPVITEDCIDKVNHLECCL